MKMDTTSTIHAQPRTSRASRRWSLRTAVVMAVVALVAATMSVVWADPVAPIINLQQAHVFASDPSATDTFGYSVGISGDTMVVGAQLDDTPAGIDAGSVYVFVRSGTTWTQQAHLFASDGAADDLFGVSIAISGNTMVVGAYADDTPAGSSVGSAYVFVRSGATWTQQAHLFASDGAADDIFGWVVAISGDTVVVGARNDNTVNGSDAGSAYVYARSGTTWSEETHLLANDAAIQDLFGFSVAISGDTIVVGAVADDTPAGTNAGSAYVFVRSGTSWPQQAHLFASDAAPFDQFGVSVAISGETVAVGANFDDTVGGVDAGSAYTFVRSGASWPQQGRLFASDGTTSDQFGFTAAISGESVVVGASFDDTAGGVDAGSAYTFGRSGTAWSPQAHLVASDGAANDQFSTSVAVSGDTAVVGAWADSTASGANAGSAYVFAPGAFNVGDVTLAEGNAGTTNATFTVTLTAPYPITTSVEVHTANGTATAGSDYIPTNTTLTFAPGQISKTVTVGIIGDTAQEDNENYYVTLSNAVGAPIGDGTGTGTITTDDLVSLSIADASGLEGTATVKKVSFTVTMSQASAANVTFKATTTNGTAIAPGDFTAFTNKAFTITAGQTTKTVAVTIVRDANVEPNETFTITLSSPVGATISDGTAIGTITNDDP
jgi:hypothetical protein